MTDFPFPPLPVDPEPEPAKRPRLSDDETKLAAVGAMFVLMYLLGLVNLLGGGLLNIDPRYAPLIMTALPPATIAITYLLGLLKKADPDLPMASRPAIPWLKSRAGGERSQVFNKPYGDRVDEQQCGGCR